MPCGGACAGWGVTAAVDIDRTFQVGESKAVVVALLREQGRGFHSPLRLQPCKYKLESFHVGCGDNRKVIGASGAVRRVYEVLNRFLHILACI